MIDGEDVVHELDLAAAPDEVFAMFVDPARLIRWLGLSVDVDARPGGRFCFEVSPGQFCEGSFVEVDQPRRLVVTWGWSDPAMDLAPGTSRLEVDLTPTPAGTHLRLVHRLLPEQLRLLHDDGWTRFLARLAAVAGGCQPPPYPAGDPEARLAELRQDRGK